MEKAPPASEDLLDVKFLVEQVERLRDVVGRLEMEQPNGSASLETIRFITDSLAQGLRDLACRLATSRNETTFP